MKYEGGSLNLDQGRLTVTLTKTQILLTQGKEIHSVPVKTITEISYGNDVHRRVGAAVALGFFTLGVGALLALAKSKKHYVGMTWADKENPIADKSQRRFRVQGRQGRLSRLHYDARRHDWPESGQYRHRKRRGHARAPVGGRRKKTAAHPQAMDVSIRSMAHQQKRPEKFRPDRPLSPHENVRPDAAGSRTSPTFAHLRG